MNKRFKKRSKPGDSKVDTFPGECDSGLSNPSRNVLAALDERITDLERHHRSRRKRKTQVNQNTCSSQRPNSVPSKTVSFSPYIRHRGDVDVAAERHAPKWKSKCRYCTTGRRPSTQTTSPCRQRFAVNRTNSSDREEPCASPNSMSDSSEFFTDVSNSPGPAKYYRDLSGSHGDHKHSWLSDTARSYQSDDHDLSSASAYYNKRFEWVHPCSRNSWVSYGSSKVSKSTSDELLRFRTNRLSHCLGGEDVLGHDSKIDRLLAKYSDYSYPRQQSPPMNYFPYKSSFLESLVTGAKSLNRSVLSKLELLNTSLSVRRQRIARNPFLSFSLPSSYTAFFGKHKDLVEPNDYTYNRSMNCATDPGMYASLRSNVITSDPLLENKRFKTYKNDYPIMPTLAQAASDSDVKAKFDRWIKPWFEKQSSAFQSKYSSILLGGSRAGSSILSKKTLSFLEGIRLQDRSYSGFHNPFMSSQCIGQPSKINLGFHGDSHENKHYNLPAKIHDNKQYNPLAKMHENKQYNPAAKMHENKQYNPAAKTHENKQYNLPAKTHENKQYNLPAKTHENKQYNPPAMTHEGSSLRKYNPHATSEADSVFNYNLNSSRLVVSDLAPQPAQSTHDTTQRPSPIVKSSRTSYASSQHSQDSIFTTSIKNCATNSGYMSILKFEKSYLDKLGLLDASRDNPEKRPQPPKSETPPSSGKWKADDNDLVNVNFGTVSRNSLSSSL